MWEATRSGEGQVVDAAMVNGSAVITTMLYGLLAQGRWRDEAGVNFSDGGANYYDTCACADGRHVAVGAIEGPFYAALLQGLGLARDELPDRADASHWPALKKPFAAVFRSKTRDDWATVFEGTDARVAPVLGLTEAPHHPHNLARGVFVERGGIVQPAPAPRFDRTANELDRLPPTPGQHTAEVLREFSYHDSDIARIIETGAVADAPTDSPDQ